MEQWRGEARVHPKSPGSDCANLRKMILTIIGNRDKVNVPGETEVGHLIERLAMRQPGEANQTMGRVRGNRQSVLQPLLKTIFGGQVCCASRARN